jgi:hypothetical protein
MKQNDTDAGRPEQSLEARLRRLKKDAGDISIAADAALPLARAIDEYMSSGVDQALIVDPELGSSTISVYTYVGQQFGAVALDVSHSAERMRVATEFVYSAGTTTANTAISTGTTHIIKPYNLAVLMSYDPRELEEWIEAISSWSSTLGRRGRAAMTSVAAGSPEDGAMAAREMLLELERTFRTTAECREDRWKKAVERFIPSSSPWRPMLENRVREAVTSYNRLSASGHAREPGTAAPMSPEETKSLIRSTIRLVRDWCVALAESGHTRSEMARLPKS